MPTAFSDTAYYIALMSERDTLHVDALAFDAGRPDQRIVTTDSVLVELLAHFSKRGSTARRAAADLVLQLRLDDRVTIVHQTPELFFSAVDLYRDRLDKGYSLTDCSSMLLMRERRLSEALTTDRHFEQESFVALLRTPACRH